MAGNPWDREIEGLSDEIATLKNIARKFTRPDKAPLIAKKASILQSRINVTAAVERMISWSKRGYQLGPKEQTLVHWAAIYATNLRKFNEERARLWSRMLWVRLIQARIGNRNGSWSLSGVVGRGGGIGSRGRGGGTAMGTDELVSLAVRYTNLSETEVQLRQALESLKARQHDLLARYSRLGIADANRNASGSLQARLGVDYEDAMRSAPARALSEFVDQLSAPVHHDASEDAWMSKVNREFGTSTQSVLDQCRNMVLTMFCPPERAEADKGQRSIKSLKEAIKKLETLEQEGVEVERKAQRHPPPVARPKMVQNKRIQAKK